MRILVLSDLHYRLPHFDWLVEAGADVDAVAIVGDLVNVVSPVPHTVQTVVVSNYLGLLADQTLVFAASGNHDLDGPGGHGEQVASWLRRLDRESLYVDGASVDVGETRFTVCPWWDGPVTRDEVGRQLAAAATDRPKRWVWLYHAPPAGTPLCHDGRRTFPDQDLADWIDSISPTWCSAVTSTSHPGQPAGAGTPGSEDTWVFNAGKQIGPVPAHITVDTDAGRRTGTACTSQEG